LAVLNIGELFEVLVFVKCKVAADEHGSEDFPVF
jgi:hypothetical protein